MFSPQTIALIKATVPLLKEQGEAITKHFYATMLREHPELKAFFNEAHQVEGSQARALAGAVLAYAANIERLEALAPALPRIVQKHVALGVQPEHYPIVGACLLRAIREVLGAEVATDAIIAAWGEAYGALAQLLIDAEELVYAGTAAQAGGWRGQRALRVARKEVESELITSFYLEPVDGAPLLAYQPGQYLTLVLEIDAEELVYAGTAAQAGGWRGQRALRVARKEVESELITSFYLEPVDGGPLLAYQPGQYLTLVLEIDGATMRRNYSLSDAPGKPWYRISVKREAGGLASNWLHDRVEPGAVLQAQAPAGEFTLDAAAERPLLLVTGGVGITPAMAMLEAAAGSGRAIRFIHAAKNGGVHAFRERVDQLARAHEHIEVVYVYDEPRAGDAPHAVGRVDRALLERHLPEDRDVDLYLLGPKPFMQSVYASGLALGVPQTQLRYEFFGPNEVLTGAAA